MGQDLKWLWQLAAPGRFLLLSGRKKQKIVCKHCHRVTIPKGEPIDQYFDFVLLFNIGDTSAWCPTREGPSSVCDGWKTDDAAQAFQVKDQIYGGCRGLSCLSVGAAWELRHLTTANVTQLTCTEHAFLRHAVVFKGPVSYFLTLFYHPRLQWSGLT